MNHLLEKNAGRNFRNQAGTMTFITLCLNGSQEFLGIVNARADTLCHRFIHASWSPMLDGKHSYTAIGTEKVVVLISVGNYTFDTDVDFNCAWKR